MNSNLKNNKIIIGSWLNTISPIVAEIMSECGFHFLVVDAEHSSTSIYESQLMFQAIKAGNPTCVPIVRLPGNDYAITKKYLDAGAMGVIAPLINAREDAINLIKSTKYPPEGLRGVGYGRSHGYGFNFDEYMKKANDDIFVCVQIEHIDAVNNLDEIFSVNGIDAAFIGPYDLSASMGITAKFNHPEYVKAWNKILKKCIEYNIIPGIHVVQPNVNEVIGKINDGFRMIAYSLDITIIGTFAREGMNKIAKVINL